MSARRGSGPTGKGGKPAKSGRAARPAKPAGKRPGATLPALGLVQGDPHGARPVARPVGCAIVTVSDTRRGRDDRSGALAHELIERAGHEVVRRMWVHDRVPEIQKALRALLKLAAVDVVILTGGTGMAARDVTPEAIRPLLELDMPGFGEMFRARSAAQVGAAAWFSRAVAGVARGRLVVALPGSPDAVDLALSQLLIPELVHAVRLLGRFETGD